MSPSLRLSPDRRGPSLARAVVGGSGPHPLLSCIPPLESSADEIQPHASLRSGVRARVYVSACLPAPGLRPPATLPQHSYNTPPDHCRPPARPHPTHLHRILPISDPTTRQLLGWLNAASLRDSLESGAADPEARLGELHLSAKAGATGKGGVTRFDRARGYEGQSPGGKRMDVRGRQAGRAERLTVWSLVRSDHTRHFARGARRLLRQGQSERGRLRPRHRRR